MSSPRRPPNKPLQRAGYDKVLGRGRVCVSPEQVNRARVLKRTRAVAERGRYAPRDTSCYTVASL